MLVQNGNKQASPKKNTGKGTSTSNGNVAASSSNNPYDALDLDNNGENGEIRRTKAIVLLGKREVAASKGHVGFL